MTIDARALESTIEVDALAPPLRLVELALDLDLSFAEPPELKWKNYYGDRGRVEDWWHLADLLGRIGSSLTWTFLVVAKDGPGRPVAQACGDAKTGLAAEVGWGNHLQMVTRQGAAEDPRVNIGRDDWQYWCARAELLPPPTVVSIFVDWFSEARVAPDFETRPVGPKAKWR